MESLNKEKKKVKLQTKKDKIKKEIEKSRKELKRKTEKSKGDKFSISEGFVKANKSVNDHDVVNINDLRKSKSLQAKAQSKVKQLLEIKGIQSLRLIFFILKVANIRCFILIAVEIFHKIIRI